MHVGVANQKAEARPDGHDLPRLSRFEVVRRLGAGGMGLVFEAIDKERAERVALKTLKRVDPQTLLLLKQEFRALQDIQHPNLVGLGELLCENATWFFTMDLVEGSDLLTYVRGEGSAPATTTIRATVTRTAVNGDDPVYLPRLPAARAFDEERLRSSLKQLVSGLDALHAASKVHRDVKPSNVLVTPEGRVIILDFGVVADMAAGDGDEGDVVGTVPYMAPEQALGEAIAPEADWYAVGCVLYECLTGRCPFQGKMSHVLMLKVTEDPVPPSSLVGDVPPDLDALCIALLDRDPQGRPGAEEILARLEGRSFVRSQRRLAARLLIPFIGRDRELSALDDAYARTREGVQVSVIVEGESGVGKSQLVRHFTKMLGGDALVLSGRCYEREAVPFKAVDGIVDAIARAISHRGIGEEGRLPPSTRHVARAFPVLSAVFAADDAAAGPPDEGPLARADLFASFREMLAHFARSAALVVVIDDVQWADADSLALLAEVLRPPAPPLLLIATVRSEALRGADGGAPFGFPGDVRRVPVGRLSEAEGIELASRLLERSTVLDLEVARSIAKEAAGHPLFVDELVRHAEMEGTTGGGRLRLDDALFERVARLEASARRVVDVLAVAGVALPQDTATRAAELPFADFARHVTALRVAHLVRTTGVRGEDTIEPYHDRVREAVASRMSEEARAACHRHIAAALEASAAADPEALATHWLGAGEVEVAAGYELRAADRAAKLFAFEHAARLYGRVLEHGRLTAEERQGVLFRKAVALGNAGLGGEAAGVYVEAAEQAPPHQALDLRRRAAVELLIAGRLDEGERILADVLRAVRMRMPVHGLEILFRFMMVRFLIWLRGLDARERPASEVSSLDLLRFDTCEGVARALTLVETVRGTYFQSRSLLIALSLGEPRRLAAALALEASHCAAVGGRRHLVHSRALSVRALELAHRAGNMEAAALAIGAAAFAEFSVGNFAIALAGSDKAVAFARERCPGAFWDLRSYAMGAVWSLAWMGHLKALAVRVHQANREAEDRGDLAAQTMLRTGMPNLVWLRTGDHEEARAVVLETSSRWNARGYRNQHYWTLLALTQIDLYAGNGEAALERVQKEWSRLVRGLILEVPILRAEAFYMRARATLAAARAAPPSKREGLLRAAQRQGRVVGRVDAPYAPGLALLIAAGVAWRRGERGEALARLTEGSSALEKTDMHLHAASARLHAGRIVGGREGAHMTLTATRWLEAEEVAEPERMATMAVAGFEDVGA